MASDFKLGSGGTVNFNSGNVTLTHVANTGLTIGTNTNASSGSKELLNLVHKTSETPYDGIATDIAFTLETNSTAIGGNWTFDYTGGASEYLWTTSSPHGLSLNDIIQFLTNGGGAAGYDIFNIYYVKAIQNSSTVTLSKTEGGTVHPGTSNSSGNWIAIKLHKAMILETLSTETDVGQESFDFVVKLKNNGSSPLEKFRVSSAGVLSVGSGSGSGTLKSNGNYDLVLQTGNSTTGSITITDGAHGNISLSPNGTGKVVFGGNLVIPDSGYIGSDSDPDAISISDTGVVTMSQNIVCGAIGCGAITSSGNMTLNATLTANHLVSTGILKINEQASASGNSNTYGQIWVKSGNPHELYFTTDDGDDIQITDGTTGLGGGGTINGMHLKCNGTNFGNSLILSTGTISTGTLNAAENNVGIGNQVFNSLTTGDHNVGVGYQSLYTVTTGTNNIGIGNLACNKITTGSNNVGICAATCGSSYENNTNNMTGTDNVGIGFGALSKVTEANRNVCISKYAGRRITTGGDNICIGNSAGDNITTGYCHIGMGSSSLAKQGTGRDNIGIGTHACFSNVSGEYNVCVGYQTMRISLNENPNGSYTGSYNVCLGYRAGFEIESGNSNVCVGHHSGVRITSGHNNTSVGNASGYNITTGDQNVCIGKNAGFYLTTGDYNICIGHSAYTNGGGALHQIVIGEGVTGEGNYTAAIGNSSIDEVHFGDGGAEIYANANINSSDSRIKDNIVDIDDSVALQQVRDIPCRNYTYKDTYRRGTDTTPGFIAQEVESVYPLAVSTHTGCIPNEYRLLTDYTLVETTLLINPTEQEPELEPESEPEPEPEPEYYWKLTVNDLTDLSTTNKYRFTFSDDTTYVYNNGKIHTEVLECIDGEPNSFLVTKQWTHIFLYGKEVTDFKKLNKAKIFTLHHSAIQQLDKTMTAEQLKIVTLESKVATLESEVATLESELAAIKTHLGL